MALALGSIAPKFNSNDKLTAADRAYIEDFRHANADDTMMASYSNVSGLQNPYHQKLKQQKQQILQQNLVMKRFQKQTILKRLFMWSIALIIVAIIFMLAAVLFSTHIQPEHYVQYFAILISTLALVFILVLIGTYLARKWKTSTSTSTTTATARNNVETCTIESD